LLSSFPGADLHPINDASVYPMRAVARIDAVFRKTVTVHGKKTTEVHDVFGSGALIGPKGDHLLTAAHLLYRAEWGGYAQSVTVYPAANAGLSPFKPAVKSQIHYYPNWLVNNNYRYDNDIAVVTLNRRYGNAFGFAALPAKGDLTGLYLNTASYPKAGTDGLYLYARGGPIGSWTSGQLAFTSINTTVGQSGSPVWIQTPCGDRYIVGVLSHEDATANYATRITPEKYAAITKWLKADGSL
jgi:V8-like Glu-specific endopeptidase